MKRLSLIISITLAILASSTVMAQTSIPSAKWSKATSFKQCVAGTCETFKNIELNLDAIEVGQIISIINLDDGVEISSFEVKSIMHSREVNMCWLGNTEGTSDTYITVSGCKLLIAA